MPITITAIPTKVTAIRQKGQITADRRARTPVIRAGMTEAAKRRPIASPAWGPGSPANITNAATTMQNATPAQAKDLAKGFLVGPAICALLALPEVSQSLPYFGLGRHSEIQPAQFMCEAERLIRPRRLIQA